MNVKLIRRSFTDGTEAAFVDKEAVVAALLGNSSDFEWTFSALCAANR
jgi:hypothetical protein